MGADVSVFEEGELEESFWKYHGGSPAVYTLHFIHYSVYIYRISTILYACIEL